MKKVCISGANGFIGRNLKAFLIKQGFQVESLSRDDITGSDTVLAEKISGSYAVINLAGAPIIHRWNKKYKEELYISRIRTTQRITNAIRNSALKPSMFISTSAVGIYKNGSHNTETTFTYDTGYLGKICKDWEASAFTTAKLTRTVIFRLGVVIGKDGGALKKLLPVFKLGFGGQIGNGKQGMPWIHIDDLLQAYLFMMNHSETDGIYNLTAPEILSNKGFTKIMGNVLRRPTLFTVPTFALKLIYNEGSIALTDGAFVEPKRLLEDGFDFQYPDMEKALQDIVKK
ncbi:MAG: TIGR01777 family protein [Bacteroidetes bacterium]|nr:TIGR01777 family protein [Bacteroidota bacterium]